MNKANSIGMDDLQLLLSVKEDNQLAFEIVYKKYWELLYRHSYSMLKSTDDAEDVVQDVFTSLWNNRKQLDISGSLSGYLYRATRNNVLDRVKHDAVIAKYINELHLDEETIKAIPDNILIEKELAIQIERCIQNLPPRTREIFTLSREKGLSHKEIADLLNISPNTVKRQISTTLEAIRTRVKFILLFF